MWTPTQELDQKLAVASHAVSYIGVKHSLFAGALAQGRYNLEPFTPQKSLVELSPSSLPLVSPLISLISVVVVVVAVVAVVVVVVAVVAVVVVVVVVVAL